MLRTIRKDREKITAAVKAGTGSRSTKVMSGQSNIVVRMEKCWSHGWIIGSVRALTSDVNVFFPSGKKPETTKIKKTFFFSCFSYKICLAIFTFCHIFIVYFLSFKVYPHFTKGFCPPHVYSPIANLLLEARFCRVNRIGL